MADNVHYIIPPQPEIGHFIRLGHTGFRILEDLHTAGRLPIKRAVVDASHIEGQTSLISSLRNTGSELILDTKSAELATPGGYSATASKLAWAHKDRHQRLSDFTDKYIKNYCEKVAGFAVTHKLDVVLCPTHLITDTSSSWSKIDTAIKIDTDICIALRQALNLAGGRHIHIDYPLIVPYGMFLKEYKCNTLMQSLKNLPFTNLWLRISNFGMSTANPAGLKKYIKSTLKVHGSFML